MANEYFARYQPYSHQELYQQVQAGDPDQVEGLASQWRSLAASVDDIAANLDRDLAGLQATWDGSAGDEFRRRVGLITGFARELSDEFSRTYEGLSLMAGPLRDTKANAEHPDATDDHDKALTGAAVGLLAGPGGAIVGGLIGHRQDQEEKERAHQRMIQQVADLAAHYDTTAPTRLPVSVTATPEDLPGTGGGATADVDAGPRVAAPGSAPTAGTGSGGGGSYGGAVATPAAAPSAGIGAAPDLVAAGADGAPVAGVSAADGASGYHTSLAGAAGLGAWGLGAGGLVAAAGSSSRPGATQPSPSPQGSGALGGAAGGYLGAPGGHQPVTGARPGTITGTQAAGAGKGAAGARGAGASAARGAHPAPAGAAGRAGQGARGANAAAAAGRRTAEEKPDEHSTWLTEDEIVWRDSDEPAPPILDSE